MKTDVLSWKWVCSTITLAISLVATAPPVVAQSGSLLEPAVYEDRNNNDVFDLGDRDLSDLPAIEDIETTESVVVNRLSLSVEPFTVKQIKAGKKVTIRGNVTMTKKQGELRISARELRIADNVSITVVSYVEVNISGPLIIGDNVKMRSLGKGPSMGYGTIFLRGKNIHTGANFYVAAYDVFSAEATEGELSFGPQANLRTLAGPMFLQATLLISAENARSSINGKGGVDFVLENPAKGVVQITGSRLSTGSEGQVSFYGGDVNFTPSLVSSPRYCLYYTNDNPHDVVCVEK